MLLRCGVNYTLITPRLPTNESVVWANQLVPNFRESSPNWKKKQNKKRRERIQLSVRVNSIRPALNESIKAIGLLLRSSTGRYWLIHLDGLQLNGNWLVQPGAVYVAAGRQRREQRRRWDDGRRPSALELDHPEPLAVPGLLERVARVLARVLVVRVVRIVPVRLPR